MGVLGWIIALFLLWVFGRGTALSASPPLGQDNAVPNGGENLPFTTTQNQTKLNTANAPAPWASVCQPSPSLAFDLPPASYTAAQTPFASDQPLAYSQLRRPVTFQQ